MDITLKSNTHASPYFSLGKGMIVYGICGIIITGVNFAESWLLYNDIYSDDYNSFLIMISILSFMSLLIKLFAEIILIANLFKTANNTHIPVFKYLAIIHLIYIVFVTAYPFLVPLLGTGFFDIDYTVIYVILRIASFITFLLLLSSDGILYVLCTKIFRQYPPKSGYVIYLPFLMIFCRLLNFGLGWISSSSSIALVFIALYGIIPISWIVLGNNFKLIAPLSENAPGHTVGEPRLDYYTPQGGQEGIDYTPQNMMSTVNSYGICFQCGKPRISPTDVFCSNCGNRF